MFDWITHFVTTLGYGGIFLLMLLENVVPPIPSELIMPLAGFTSSRSGMALVPAILAGCLGSLVGTLPWYYLGRRVSQQQLMNWAERYGRWLAISPSGIDRTIQWFRLRRGLWVIGLARMVPGIRTYISVPAGLSEMPLLPYLVYSAAGTLIWVSGLAIAGYFLGDQFELVQRVLGPVAKIVVLGLIIGFAAWVWYRKHQQRQS